MRLLQVLRLNRLPGPTLSWCFCTALFVALEQAYFAVLYKILNNCYVFSKIEIWNIYNTSIAASNLKSPEVNRVFVEGSQVVAGQGIFAAHGSNHGWFWKVSGTWCLLHLLVWLL